MLRFYGGVRPTVIELSNYCYVFFLLAYQLNLVSTESNGICTAKENVVLRVERP